MNVAYIDNQNLYLACKKNPEPWQIDMRRFRRYLKQKYKVEDAYLFMGTHMDSLEDFYHSLQRMGYILVFREHSENMATSKKGNVDVDLVFKAMRDIVEQEPYDKVVLVSGDGDYKRMVDYLIKKSKLEKVLLPSKARASSLYKRISRVLYAYLDTPDMRVKLGVDKKAAS